MEITIGIVAKEEISHFMEEMKGRDTAMMMRVFNAYKQERGDTIVYRLFSKNSLAFWRYRDYIKDNRYNLPYKNWEDIKAIRGKIEI